MRYVSGGFLAAIADWLACSGQGSAALCARIRRFRADEAVAPAVAENLLATAASLTGDPYAALRIGQGVAWQHLGALGHMLAGTRTLEELLNGYVYYESLFYGTNIANLQRDADGVTLYWTVGDGFHQYARFSISSVVAVIRACGIPPSCISTVLLPAGDDFDSRTCADILGCNHIVFGKVIGVTISRDSLGRGLQRRGAENDHAARLAALFPELDDVALASAIHDAIASTLPQGNANLRQVASQLAMSPRTLQRRLAVIPDGLRGAIARVRMQLAQEYLQDPAMTLLAVSMLLGYSEQSAFQLAFRRHHGCAPGQWRRMNRAMSSCAP